MSRTLLYILAFFFLTSCSVTQYHTAKPLEKGEKQMYIALDSYVAPSLQQYYYGEKTVRKDAIKTMIPVLPTFEYNWGTTKRLDHTVSLGFEKQLSYAVKFGLIGNNNSKFYMSARPEIGIGITGAFEPFLWNKNSLILTQELGDKFSLTFSPGLTFVVLEREMFLYNSSFAMHYGTKNRVFIAGSFIHSKEFGIVEQFSIGYIFKLNGKGTNR